jgi:hypothetical protein
MVFHTGADFQKDYHQELYQGPLQEQLRVLPDRYWALFSGSFAGFGKSGDSSGCFFFGIKSTLILLKYKRIRLITLRSSGSICNE